MKQIALLTLCALLLAACSYDEGMDLLPVSIQLVYPEGSIEPYAGARVELTDAAASIFVDSTDATGTAHFTVPAGLYSMMSSATVETYDYRYFFNGTLSRHVISADSTNRILLPLKMSKKRIVH